MPQIELQNVGNTVTSNIYSCEICLNYAFWIKLPGISLKFHY